MLDGLLMLYPKWKNAEQPSFSDALEPQLTALGSLSPAWERQLELHRFWTNERAIAHALQHQHHAIHSSAAEPGVLRGSLSWNEACPVIAE